MNTKRFRLPCPTVSTVLMIVLFLPLFSSQAGEAGPQGMLWIPGGQFRMGGEQRNERPTHQVEVDGFWMDDHDVTNLEFDRFVKATGYLTTAERKPDWAELQKRLPSGTSKAGPSAPVRGSWVFTPPAGRVDTSGMGNFWRWVPGANWRHPEGPGSNIQGREQHPVVQVSWDDAVAYAKWAGKRLPTEAEWEFAARGGLENKRFVWGDEFMPRGKFMANVWEGKFPYKDTGEDGFIGTSPVKSFPPNGYGLYDMSGNVWQWCRDWYCPDIYAQEASEPLCINPTGP